MRLSHYLRLLLLLPGLTAAQQIPADTTLPVMLNSTLDASKDQPGRRITGRIMQDVPLPNGGQIARRSEIVGHVVSAQKGANSRLAVQFDYVISNGRKLRVVAHLRALASMMEVCEAKMPTNAVPEATSCGDWDNYGTSPSDWNTVQVGGAGVYRGSGELVSGGQVIGRATDYGAVTAKLIASPALGCSASESEQALWIFSPWACGTYGFNDLKIAHAVPFGQIELESRGNVRVSGGSGWLLKTQSLSSVVSSKE